MKLNNPEGIRSMKLNVSPFFKKTSLVLLALIIFHFAVFSKKLHTSFDNDVWLYKNEIFFLGHKVYERKWSDPPGLIHQQSRVVTNVFSARGILSPYSTCSKVVKRNEWTRRLHKFLKDTDAIAISPVLHNSISWFKHEITNDRKIKEIISKIDVIAEERPGYCMCSGEHKISFLKNNIVIVSLSVHHGESLRICDGTWEKGWSGNLDLTAASRKYIRKLLIKINKSEIK